MASTDSGKKSTKGVDMLLAKNCRPEHSVIATGSIRLGSLYEYRTTYEEQIADRHEGKFTFTLNLGEEFDIDKRWYNALFGRFLYIGSDNQYPVFDPPGSYRTKCDSFTKTGEFEHTARVKVKNLSMEREVPNSLIFCMSQVPDKGSAMGLFSDYHDRWFVDSQDCDFFANALVRAVARKITQGRKLGIHIVDPRIPLDRLNLSCNHGLVKYLPRIVNLTDDKTFSVQEFLNLCYELEFYKPPCYAHELEYRFNIKLYFDNRLLPIHINSMIIDASEIKPLISL